MGKKDTINPNHYTSFKIPPNVYITENHLEWEVGNVVKYVCRAGLKDKSDREEDIQKALWYLTREIQPKE